MKNYRISHPSKEQLVLSRDTTNGRVMGIVLLVVAAILSVVKGMDWYRLLLGEPPTPYTLILLGLALAFCFIGIRLFAQLTFKPDANSFTFDNTRAQLVVAHTYRQVTHSHAIACAQIAAFVVRRIRRRTQNSQQTRNRTYYVYATSMVLTDGSVVDLNNFSTRPEPATRLAEQLIQHCSAATIPQAIRAVNTEKQALPNGVHIAENSWPKELRWHNPLWRALLYTIPVLAIFGLVFSGIILQTAQIGPSNDHTAMYVAIAVFAVFTLIIGIILYKTAFRQIALPFAIRISKEAVQMGY